MLEGSQLNMLMQTFLAHLLLEIPAQTALQDAPFLPMKLYSGHPGRASMKCLARGKVCSPGMDGEIKGVEKQCWYCQKIKPSPLTAPTQPWCWPTRPWSRLHVDFSNPIAGNVFLLVMNAHSKWIRAFQISIATAFATIQWLRQLFGISESIVLDNGPQSAVSEFQTFCQLNGTRQNRAVLNQSSFNGLARRTVKIFKQGLKKKTVW